MTLKCSIVIRAYNEEAHIGRLLSGIWQQTVREVQTIVVDSGSTDATASIAHSFGAEVLHIRPEDFTFGRSLNAGIRQARADLVVIASAHVYPVYPDWLEKLLAPFSGDKVVLTYGKQRGSSESQFSEQQIFLHWYPAHSQTSQNHPFCNNANAAIRVSAWKENPYDEAIPALEDLAWAKWAMEAGYALSYVAEAEVIHVHNESWQGIANRYRREGMAFKRIYPHEKFNLFDLVRLWLANVANDFSAAVQQRVLWRQWSKIMRFRWMQFWGTYQGYHQSGLLTWNLRRAFYYPNRALNNHKDPPRAVPPIQYPHMVEPAIGEVNFSRREEGT